MPGKSGHGETFTPASPKQSLFCGKQRNRYSDMLRYLKKKKRIGNLFINCDENLSSRSEPPRGSALGVTSTDGRSDGDRSEFGNCQTRVTSTMGLLPQFVLIHDIFTT